MLVTAGTVVGLLVGVLTLFESVRGWFTDPPPAAISTRIVDARLETVRQRLGDFLSEQQLSREGLRPRELAERGMIYTVEVRLQGGLGKTLRLRWQLYEQSGRRVPGAEFNQALGEYAPENQDHQNRARFWLPLPPRAGTYFSRFTLAERGRPPLDDLTTKPFTATARP